jgi:predicted HNH restriction endonuclease
VINLGLDGTKWGEHEAKEDFKSKEKDRAKSRRYYNRHKDKVKSKTKKHYFQKRRDLAEEFGGKCAFCDSTRFDTFNFHHNVPMLVKGNKMYHYIANKDILVLLCARCHITWHEVMDDLGIDDIFKEMSGGY